MDLTQQDNSTTANNAAASPPGDSSTPARHGPIFWVVQLVKWILCLTVVIYVGRALIVGFEKIDWQSVHFRAVPLLLSCVALIAMFACQLFVYRQLIKAYARPVPWKRMIPVAWVSALGKYVPGNFAAVAGKMYLLNRLGVSGTVAFSLAVLQDGMAAVVGLLVAAPLVDSAPVRALWRGSQPVGKVVLSSAWPKNLITIICVLVAGAICLHPRVFAAIANFFLRRFNRQPLRGSLRAGEYAAPLLGTVAQWLFSGISLWLMIAAIAPIDASQIPFCTAAAALAMTIGYLVLFAPAGLGVRDGILLALLTPLIGPARAALTVLAFRVAQTIVEVLLAAVGVAMIRRSS